MLKWLRRKESEREVENGSVNAEPEPRETIKFEKIPPEDGAWLEMKDKNGDSLFLPLSKSPLLIGTSENCDVLLDERFDGIDKVRPEHARIELWRDRWVITPLDRDALVFVSGKRTGENVLKDGMEVYLGGEDGVRFVFREAKPRE